MTCTSHTPEEKRLVTLIDGREVCSCSEEWRHECEARWALALPSLAKRREHLDGVERNRGRAARDRLADTMMTMHNINRAGRAQEAHE
jgi:hypothetical protein